MKNTVVILLLVTLLASCKEEKREGITSKSPGDDIVLSVSASRHSMLDPWVTNLEADGPGLKGKISFEFYASDVNYETVSFVWDKSGDCVITFKQRDNTQRIFEFMPRSSTAMWRDVSPK